MEPDKKRLLCVHLLEIYTVYNKKKHEIWEVITHTHGRNVDKYREVSSRLSEAALVALDGCPDTRHVQACPR